MNTAHYKAFISYSHSDEKWARWLQKSLETYRVPKRLVGKDAEFGKIPARLRPIFRDREDLSSASDVSTKVKQELDRSEFLIVICSPASAQSKWVNEEIRYFRSLGSEERILALIVDGDPNGEKPEVRCFPDALTINLDGSRGEPLAADVRKWADGKLLAKLKIVSGILGLRLDELRRRDQQMRRKNRMVAGIFAALIIAVTASLAISTLTSRKAAQMQRTNTEDLLSYMLGNLKELDPIVGLEVVDQNDKQVLQYLKSQGFSAMGDEQLVEWGLEQRKQGMSNHGRGNLGAAMEQFQKSRAAFIELHQREGSTKRALFELGQAEFWVGYVYMDKGDLDEAEESMTRYGAISRRLVNADPNDAEMVMELAYTLTNLGAVEMARSDPDIDYALELTQSGVQYHQIALVLDPENSLWRQELAGTVAFLADAWMETCDLGKTFDFRQQRLELARELYDASPEDDKVVSEMAYALSGMASVQRLLPILDQALENLQQAYALLNQLAEQDDENQKRRLEALTRTERTFAIRFWTETPGALWPEMIAWKNEMDTFFSRDSVDQYDTYVNYAFFLARLSRLAWLLEKKSESKLLLNDAIDRLYTLVEKEPDSRWSRSRLAHAVFIHWERNGESPFDEADPFLKGYLADPEKVRSCSDASLGARLEIMRGNKTLAKNYTDYLLSRGYYEPGFVEFCQRYELCD